MKIQDRYIYLILLLIVFTSTLAQEIKETPGVMFLEIQTDSRSAAMGALSNVSESSAFGVFYNPSANLFSSERLGVGASLSARDNFKDMNLYSLGAYYNLSEKSGLSFGVRYFDLPTIDIIGESSSSNDKLKPKEIALDVGYGHKLTDNLSLSISLKYINSDLGTYLDMKKGNAVAAGLGLTYMVPIKNFEGGNWSLALAASNFGTKIKYNEQEYHLPSSVSAGTAVHLPFSDNHKFTGTINARYRALPSNFSTFEAGVGAEYNFYEYGFLRTGYHLGDDEKGLGDFVTFGAGLNIKPIKLDFAYQVGMPNSEFRHVAFISLSALF